MISAQQLAEIRRLFEVEGWRRNTIARHLGIHHSTVRRALARAGLETAARCRTSKLDAYEGIVRETFAKYPQVPASVVWEMVRRRGYEGGPDYFRHRVAQLGLRPWRAPEAFLELRTLPGEQAQVDWLTVGNVAVRGGTRRVMAFVMVLSYSRRIFVRFFHDERVPNLLAAHVAAFAAFGGVPRVVLYDNPRTIVIERRADAIRFHPQLLALADHYGFEPRPVPYRRPNEKGRVERANRYLRSSFLPLRKGLDVATYNHEVAIWSTEVADRRRHREDRSRTVAQAAAEERPRLLELPAIPFEAAEQRPVAVSRTATVAFDSNRYSVPSGCVGRTLLLVATSELVRVLDGTTEVARHVRSFNRGELVEDPAHTDALRAAKRLARLHRGQERLLRLVPVTEDLLVALAQRQRRLASAVDELLLLLDDHGAEALAQAVTEAIAAGSPHPATVRLVLTRVQRRDGKPVELGPTIDPRARDIVVTPHRLADYDPEDNDD